MKKIFFQKFVMGLLLAVILSVWGAIGGTILNGDANEAYQSANATLTVAAMTPIAPVIYPSDIIKVCDTVTNTTVEIIFQSKHDWNEIFKDPNYRIGPCK